MQKGAWLIGRLLWLIEGGFGKLGFWNWTVPLGCGRGISASEDEWLPPSSSSSSRKRSISAREKASSSIEGCD